MEPFLTEARTFFFEKKNQKTFATWHARRGLRPLQTFKSSLVLSFKKEQKPPLSRHSRRPARRARRGSTRNTRRRELAHVAEQLLHKTGFAARGRRRTWRHGNLLGVFL